MKVLGIETSCDETAAAVVERDEAGKGKILSSIVLSQIEQHAQFGGVVPEIAARAHLEGLDPVISAALGKAECRFADIDVIAATAGPGLIGGVMVGLMTAKGICAATGKPLVAVNHLEGHALTPRLSDGIEFPYLLLLVSGGHTQILYVAGVGQYTRIATTIDDALGEAFDKTAKLLGLAYPGGPAVEKAAANGNATRFVFPRPLKGQARLDFSFSGLKTAVRQQAENLAPLSQSDIGDICASFQAAIVDVLADRVRRAMRIQKLCQTLVVAGGVAANQAIRSALEVEAVQQGWRFVAPPLALCSDNAAMIAWAGAENFALGHVAALDVSARSRWPLDGDAVHRIGSGRRGAKA